MMRTFYLLRLSTTHSCCFHVLFSFTQDSVLIQYLISRNLSMLGLNSDHKRNRHHKWQYRGVPPVRYSLEARCKIYEIVEHSQPKKKLFAPELGVRCSDCAPPKKVSSLQRSSDLVNMRVSKVCYRVQPQSNWLSG